MAIPISLMKRLAWKRLKGLKGKMGEKARNFMRNRIRMSIAKRQMEEIARLAAELKIPENRLTEYSNRLKLLNTSFAERGDMMVKTLTEMKQLAIKTEISPKKLRRFVERKGIEWVVKQMKERAETMDAMQAQQEEPAKAAA